MVILSGYKNPCCVSVPKWAIFLYLQTYVISEDCGDIEYLFLNNGLRIRLGARILTHIKKQVLHHQHLPLKINFLRKLLHILTLHQSHIRG